jgi:hypothetical protein
MFWKYKDTMKNYITFYPHSNRFVNDGDLRADFEKYNDYIDPMNELINDIPVEYNDYKLLCKYFIFNYSIDFPHLFLNQKILKDKVCNYFNIKEI